ncbi:MAG: hypothetical protein RIQ43_437 [Pseudomonadota bacterium]
MEDPKKQIMSWMKWVVYPFMLLVIVAIFLFRGEPGERLHTVVERYIVLGLVGFFSLVLLAFFLHLLGSLRRPHAADGVGSAQIVLRKSPWLLRIVLTVYLAVNLAALVLWPDLRAAAVGGFGAVDAWPQIVLEVKAVMVFFSAVALFLLLAFTHRAVLNPPWFVLGREGFLYEPGGISPGLIRWRDVRDMKEDTVLAGSNSYTGPRLDPVLVITLRDYEKYLAAYNPVLRFLVRAATRVLRYQTKGGDIYLNPLHFGARYPEIKAAMLAHWREAVPERP